MARLISREQLRQRLRLRRGEVAPPRDVPGPSANPATNLLFADVVMRMGSYVLRDVVERAFLKGRYGRETARDIVSNRSIARSLTSVAIAKVGTRSLPGAAVVGTSVLIKLLYDRSRSRRENLAEGDDILIERANTPTSRIDT